MEPGPNADPQGGSRPVPRLFLVRHGTTEWSRSGQHTSRTDLPLEPEGEEQARLLASILRGRSFSLVLTSPLERARATSRIAGFGDLATVDGDLREWDYGCYEGRRTVEIHRERPGWSLFTDGAPEGETAAAVGERADRVIARVRSVPGDSLCFAHGHILRVVAARWLGLPPVAARMLRLDAGSLSILAWERQDPAIERWNLPPLVPG
jgi:probable phosphoglycerate mutase